MVLTNPHSSRVVLYPLDNSCINVPAVVGVSLAIMALCACKTGRHRLAGRLRKDGQEHFPVLQGKPESEAEI